MENKNNCTRNWMENCPLNWKQTSIGNEFSLRNEKVSDSDYQPLSVTMLPQGVVPQLDSAAKSDAHEDRKKVCKNDFVINSRSDRRMACGVSDYDGSVSLINLVLAPKYEVFPKYAHYLFKNPGFADEFYKWGHGIVDDLWTTRWEDMKRIKINLPKYSEQVSIVNFLDDLCSKINLLIKTNEKEIGLLSEMRRALISEATTTGLCFDKHKEKRTKQTDYKMMPTIPEDWTIVRSKYVAKISSKIKIPFSDGRLITYAPMECVRNDSFTPSVINSNKVPTGLSSFKDGDVLLAKITPCFENGNVAIATNLKNGFGVGSSELVPFSPNKEYILPRYLMYFLQSNSFVEAGKATIRGIGGLRRVTPEFLSNFAIALPSLQEQKEIVDYLDKRCKLISQCVSLKQKENDFLKDLKQSFVYETITGVRRASK
jgi:type I restriction enzyme S subunit